MESRAKQQIKNAFVRLLMTHKFENISVKDILEESTYSKGSFYSHFNDKYDLAQKFIEEEAMNFETRIKEQLTIHANNENLKEIITRFAFQYIKDNEQTYHVIVRELIPGYSLKRYSKYCNSIFDEFGKWTVLDNKQINKQLYSMTMSSAFYGCVQYWESNNFSLSVDYITAQFLLFFENSASSITMQ